MLARGYVFINFVATRPQVFILVSTYRILFLLSFVFILMEMIKRTRGYKRTSDKTSYVKNQLYPV